VVDVTVQNLEDDVHARLEQLAQREGLSVADVAREILRKATRQLPETEPGFGTRLAARFALYDLDQSLPELPRQQSEPISFEE